jgi:hypothetical protein
MSVIPPNRLLVTTEPGTDDAAVLSSERERTRLVVEGRGLPVEPLYMHGAGWQAHLEVLSRYLVGGPSNWKARWTELIPAYELLGRTATK